VSRSNDFKPTGIPVHAPRPSSGLPALEELFNLDSENCTPQNICAQLAKDFHVRETEVGLLWIHGRSLKFLFPVELSGTGTIPLSSSGIAARTATTRTSEMFNNIAQINHVSVFEMVKLGTSQGGAQMIQKMMSVPMLDHEGEVCGVIQVSRKGFDLPSAGPDFTNEDLQRLELAASIAGRLLASAGSAG